MHFGHLWIRPSSDDSSKMFFIALNFANGCNLYSSIWILCSNVVLSGITILILLPCAALVIHHSAFE